MRKSSTVWIWQHDKRTDDYKIILNCVRKFMKINEKKRLGKAKLFFLKKLMPGRQKEYAVL